MKKTGFAFTLITFCLVSAAATLAILGSAARAARLRVASQYNEPDYIRYISEGYGFDTVSSKKNYLITLTDGELPVRIHVFTVDEDKNTIDILELPPDSYVIADGYFGTLRDAFSTSVYTQITEAALRLEISGSVSFDAVTFGDIAQLLEVKLELPKGVYRAREIEVTEDIGKKIALDGFCYSGGDKEAVALYQRLLAGIFSEMSRRGSFESFSLLMNLIVNRFDTDMPMDEIIAAVNSVSGVKLRKINLRLAVGYPAKFGGSRIWSLSADGMAELLNKYFRVKGIEIPKESLSIPAAPAGEFPYEDLPVKAADILE